MNKKLTKLLSVFIIAGAIGTGSAIGLTGCSGKHEHEANSEWSTDETQHWHDCTANDGEKLDLGNHEYDNDDDPDCNVCGHERTIAVSGITLDKTTATLKMGETVTVTLTATVTPSSATNKSVTWSSSDTTVATVANGVVTALKAGTATITAKTADGNKTATCVVTVQAAQAEPETPVNPPAANKYTVTWKNYDGSVLKTDPDVEEGTTPTYDGATPTKEGDAQYSYTFNGWDKEVTAVTGNVEYTATFTQTINKYTITWKNYDGSVLKTDPEVPYGTTPTYDGATPTKEGDAQYSYTFNGWDKEVVAVTGNVEYTATFTQTVNKYTVTWKNYDGSVLKTDPEVPYGTTPTYDGATPEREDEGGKSYNFIGWDKEVTAVTGNVEYTANYEELAEGQYAIVYNLQGHGSAIANGKTEDGKLSGEAAVPEATGYNFSGWYLTAECEGEAIDFATHEFTAKTTVYAKWTAVEYSISYVGADGLTNENVATYTIESEDITLAALTKDYYDFLGWYNGEDKVETIAKGSTGNLTLTAKWQATEYTITYLGVEGATHSNPTTYTVESGEITLTDATKAGHRFNGWTIEIEGTPNEIVAIPAGYHGDLTITADFVQQLSVIVVDASGSTLGTVTIDKGDSLSLGNCAELIEDDKYEPYRLYSADNFNAGIQYDGAAITEDSLTFVLTQKLTQSGFEEVIEASANNYPLTVTYYEKDSSGETTSSNILFAYDGTKLVDYTGETPVVRNYDNVGDTYTEYYKKGDTWYKRSGFPALSEEYYDFVVEDLKHSVTVLKNNYALSDFTYDDLKDEYTYTENLGEKELSCRIVISGGKLVSYEKTDSETHEGQEYSFDYTSAIELPEAQEYTKFIEMAYDDNNYVAEDFSGFIGNLSAVKRYDAIYADKANENEYFSVNADGKLTQTTNGANFGLTIPFGVPKQNVQVYLETSVSDVGSDWKFIKIGDEFILGTGSKKDSKFYLQYSVDGGTTYTETEIEFKANTTYVIEFDFDGNDKSLNLTIDDGNSGNPISAHLTKPIYGMYMQSSKSGARKITIDNIAVVAEQQKASEYYETAKAEFEAYYAANYVFEPVFKVDEDGHQVNDEKGEPIVEKQATHYYQKDKVEETYAAIIADMAKYATGGDYAESPAISLAVQIDDYRRQLEEIETDAEIDEAKRAAEAWLAETYSATDYTITSGDYANHSAYVAAKSAFISTVGTAHDTATIVEAQATFIAGIAAINTDAEIIASVRQNAVTSINDYKTTEIEAIVNTTAKENIASAKATAIDEIDALEIDDETITDADGLIAAIEAKVSATQAALDSAIASADDNAGNHKEEYIQQLKDYKAELYGEEQNETLTIIVTNGTTAINAVEDTAPATDAEAVLNEYKLKLYVYYNTRLYNEYVKQENDKVHANDSTIDLTSGAPEVSFDECKTNADVDAALAAAEAAYDDYVGGVLANTTYTITYTGYDESLGTTETVAYGNKATAKGITVTEASDKMLKGWKVSDTDEVYDFSTPVYGNIQLVAYFVDAITVTPTDNTFSMDELKNQGLSDKDILTQENLNTVSNKFITIGENIAYRGTWIQGKGDMLSVTFNAAGTLEISARGTGSGKSITFSLVNKNDETITVNGDKTADGSKFTTIKFTVTVAGEYTLVATGAESGYEARIQSIKQTQEAYKVEKIHVTNVTVSSEAEDNKLELNGSLQLTATITPDNASVKTVTWKITEGSEYATISADGKLTATDVGTVKVVATVDGVESDAYEVEIYKNSVTEVTITRQDGEEIVDSKITITTGTVQLVGAVNENATIQGVTWSSSNESAATVDENGLVTYVGVGEAIITATAKDDATVTATITIACTEVAVASVAFGEDQPSTVNIGEDITLTASALAADGGIPTQTGLNWESSDTSIATVENGVVTGVAEGSVTITVTSVNYVDDETTPNLKAEMTVTVNKVAVQSVTVSGATSVTVDSTVTLTATINPTNASEKTVTWAVTNGTGSATISADGVLTGVAAGTVTVTATVDGITSAAYTVTVEAKPTLTTIGFTEVTDAVITQVNATRTAGSYYDDYSIIDFVYDSDVTLKSEGSPKDSHINFGGALKSEKRYIKIDLSKYTGTAKISFTVYSGSANRSMFISTKVKASTSEALSGSLITVATAKTTSSLTGFELACGSEYYICTDNTVALSALTVELDVTAKKDSST